MSDEGDIKEEDAAFTRMLKILKLFLIENIEHEELFTLLDEEFQETDINMRDVRGDGLSFLHHCTTSSRFHIMEYLLKKGANPNIVDTNSNETPLLHSARKGLLAHVVLLIKYGANPDIYDKHNDSPLLWAAYRGHLDVVIYLIEQGANPDHLYVDGRNAIRWAIRNKHLDIVIYLSKYLKDVNYPDNTNSGIFAINMDDTIREYLVRWMQKNKLCLLEYVKNNKMPNFDHAILNIIFEMYAPDM